MYLQEIKSYKDYLGISGSPSESVSEIARNLGDVAQMLAHTLVYICDVHCPAEEVDTLHVLIRSSLMMLREVGEVIDGISEQAKDWTAPGVHGSYRPGPAPISEAPTEVRKASPEA